MAGRVVRGLLPLVMASSGCLPGESIDLVSPNPFGTVPSAQLALQVRELSRAAEQVGKRVEEIGLKVTNANPGIGLRPVFITIGSPGVEVFHRGANEVYVSEGLVRQCQTEGQLAAVLCAELSKMVSEREALASPGLRLADRGPSADVPVGADYGGAFGPADGTRLAELAKQDRLRHRPGDPTPPPPAPEVLARTYLTRAGYAASELDDVARLLRAAEDNGALERQFKTGVPPR
jgi:hypothetical protein